MGAKFAALSVVGLSAIFFPGAMHTSRADITGLVVDFTKDIGPFRQGKPYREIEAHLNGVAPGGAYSVPVTLAFPKQASNHNRLAIVDVVNTVTIGNDKFVLGGRPIPTAPTQLSDDFLFGTGHAYVAVIWDKKAVEVFDNGKIVAGADGFTIIADAARLARDPSEISARRRRRRAVVRRDHCIRLFADRGGAGSGTWSITIGRAPRWSSMAALSPGLAEDVTTWKRWISRISPAPVGPRTAAR